MITSRLGFLLDALDLSQSGMAREIGTSTQHIHNICAGHSKPSFEVAQKIERVLKETWSRRNGVTVPPEVKRIVFEILYPPPPFDPFDGEEKRGPGRPKKTDSGEAVERRAATSATHAASAHSVTAIKAAVSSESNLAQGFVHSEQNPSDSNIIQATEAFRRAIAASPKSIPAPQTQLQASSVAPLWSRASLVDIRTTARIRALLTDDMPDVLSMRQQFYNDLHAESPSWLKGLTLPETYTVEQFKRWRDAVNARLRRAMPVKLRARKSDEDLAHKKQVVANYALTFAAAVESHSHSKGAFQDRSWMDLRASLLGFWDNAEFRERISNVMGRDISYATFERIFHAEFGKVSPTERAMKNFYAATKATDPEYAGAHFEVDGTGIPVNVLEAWGRQKNNGDLAQQAVFMTDRASLRTWIHVEATTSEVYLWSPLLLKFFESENYCPETICMDEGGRGFNALRHAHNWVKSGTIELEAGQRLALAAGARPYVHAPQHAQGKGTVEANVKAGKSALKRILVKRFAAALFKEIATAPINYRTVQQQHEWVQILAEWEASLNARIIKRVGDGTLTRENVWALPEYVARRNERALAADWRDKYRDIISSGFVMELQTENGLFHGKARAELRTPLLTPVAKGSLAILFPGGLRAGDENLGTDLLRGVIVEDRAGQPRYHAIEAMKVSKTFLGFETDRGRVGEFKALPETEHGRKNKAWVEAGKIIPAAIREAHDASQQKQGTTDTWL